MEKSHEVRDRLADAHSLIVKGHTVDEALRRAGVGRALFSAWLQEHNGQIAVPLNVIESLYSENTQMRKQIAKLSADKQNSGLLDRMSKVGRLLSAD